MLKKIIALSLSVGLICAFPAGAFAESTVQETAAQTETENTMVLDEQQVSEEEVQTTENEILQNSTVTDNTAQSESPQPEQPVQEEPVKITVTYASKTLCSKAKYKIGVPSSLPTPITKWTSSNSTVAPVTSSGMVTAKKVGTATVKGYNDAGQLCHQVTIKVVLGKDYALFVAHRGYGKPENTLPAFRNAVKAGFGGIELDVWESKATAKTSKPFIIVMHNSNLKSCTGKSLKTEKLNWANRSKYKITKNTNGYGKQLIPSIDEAFSCIYSEAAKQGNNDFVVEIDVKNSLSDRAVKHIVSVVGKHRVHILSANTTVLDKFKKYRKYKTTEVWCCTGSDNATKRNSKINSAIKNKYDGMSLPMRNASAATVKKIRSNGLQMGIYGISKAADVQKYADMGCNRFNMYNKVFQ